MLALRREAKLRPGCPGRTTACSVTGRVLTRVLLASASAFSSSPAPGGSLPEATEPPNPELCACKFIQDLLSSSLQLRIRWVESNIN